MKISIITPNYNYGNYINKTIKSIINQNYDNIEYVIVDDGSTDNSVEVIKSFQTNKSIELILIEQPNKGQSAALNAALKHVTGDVIGWINSDDQYCADVFKSIANIFMKDSNIDAIFGDIYIIDPYDNIIGKTEYLPFDYMAGTLLGFGKMVSSNAIFWKTEIMEGIEGFNQDYVYAMDSEFWSRLLYKRNVVHIKKYIACFRIHENAKTNIRQKLFSAENYKGKCENKETQYKAYSHLKVSKIIPYPARFPLWILYKVKRHMYKLVNGHYHK